jgi:hypothetical protein
MKVMGLLSCFCLVFLFLFTVESFAQDTGISTTKTDTGKGVLGANFGPAIFYNCFVGKVNVKKADIYKGKVRTDEDFCTVRVGVEAHVDWVFLAYEDTVSHELVSAHTWGPFVGLSYNSDSDIGLWGSLGLAYGYRKKNLLNTGVSPKFNLGVGAFFDQVQSLPLGLKKGDEVNTKDADSSNYFQEGEQLKFNTQNAMGVIVMVSINIGF